MEDGPKDFTPLEPAARFKIIFQAGGEVQYSTMNAYHKGDPFFFGHGQSNPAEASQGMRMNQRDCHFLP